jgi:PAS domain-containing protein
MIQLVEFMPSEEYLPIYRKKRNGRIQSGSDKFFTMSSEMMIIASTHFIKINPAAIKILGYTEEEQNNPFSTSSIQKIKTILKVKS